MNTEIVCYISFATGSVSCVHFTILFCIVMISEGHSLCFLDIYSRLVSCVLCSHPISKCHWDWPKVICTIQFSSSVIFLCLCNDGGQSRAIRGNLGRFTDLARQGRTCDPGQAPL